MHDTYNAFKRKLGGWMALLLLAGNAFAAVGAPTAAAAGPTGFEVVWQDADAPGKMDWIREHDLSSCVEGKSFFCAAGRASGRWRNCLPFFRK